MLELKGCLPPSILVTGWSASIITNFDARFSSGIVARTGFELETHFIASVQAFPDSSCNSVGSVPAVVFDAVNLVIHILVFQDSFCYE